MEQRVIPGTDLRVSLLGFGNFVFGTNWWGDFTDDDGVQLQNAAVDLGVNFFDTAAAYGNGRAESLLARTIDYAGRDNLVISTKYGYDFYSDPGEAGGHRERRQDFSPAFVRYDLEQSLQRLKIDCVDLYQAHNLKLPQFRDDLFDLMETLKQEGKIRYWGVALGPAIGWREEGYQAFIDHHADVVQTVMNLYEQDPGREFCEIAAKLGRGGVIARVPTNSGILDEEFSSPNHTFPAQDHRKFRDRNWLIFGLKKNDIIRPMAKQLGCSVRQLAMLWLASQPAMVAIEPNLLTVEDVKEFAAACDGRRLDADMLAKLDALYATDFHLGEAAHPCDWKSSVTPTGSIHSAYQTPAIP
ncbi:MAG: aldo/keto reductase [Phycisphaeraceae bacterium]|nr:aldo/keto reductase [Phycisphaeraceae bacterium]